MFKQFLNKPCWLSVVLLSLVALAGCEENIVPDLQTVCGNGTLDVDEGEECDDGSMSDGDGCSSQCRVEPGWSCSETGCVREGNGEVKEPTEENKPKAICGNGILEEGEACDDENTLDNDGCSAGCKVEDGWTCEGKNCHEKPRCGDGNLDEGEKCDDKNNLNGDGCSSECAIEDGWSCVGGKHCKRDPYCGDGVLDDDEACDDGNENEDDGCSKCKIDDGYRCWVEGELCYPMTCGDGILDPEKEACDRGKEHNDAEYNFEKKDGLCMPNCQKPGFCGDGELQAKFEKCDDGENNGSGAYGSCKVDCSGIEYYCGDGIRSHLEQCDDGGNADGDGCSAGCQVEKGWNCPADGSGCVRLPCGNGQLDTDKGETCDDNNMESGDGCNSVCLVEKGWKCLKPGKPCEKVACGDGVIDQDGGEECEDGNTTDGDGCSAFCRIEAGWICPKLGKPCVARSCGDGIIAKGETCDDGNAESGDGCSYRCLLEEGYYCPEVGKPCVEAKCGNGIVEGLEECDEPAAKKTQGCVSCKVQDGWKCESGNACTKTTCGDGKVEGTEQCDDKNQKAGDGCNSVCKLEEGWHCPTPGSACVHSVCGNGTVEGLEECDDGNTKTGDGCDSVCKTETIFSCSEGVCRPVCGDGITLWEYGEECDDGNLISGDGCSSQCETEDGFDCTEFSNKLQPSINVPITYRDFRGWPEYSANGGDGYASQAVYNSNTSCFRLNYGHPDFQNVNQSATGMVKTTLSGDAKPVWTGTSSGGVHCHESFNMWYRDTPGMNLTFHEILPLTQEGGANSNKYVYDSSAFFPLTNRGYGNYSDNRNFGFTSELQTYFKFNGGETLTFRGDDDVWVFINGVLAVDIGGCHSPTEKSVTLTTTNHSSGNPWVEKYNIFSGGIYSIHLFQAERMTSGSNYKLTLTGFLNVGATTCHSVCGDGLIRGGEECDLVSTVATAEQARRLAVAGETCGGTCEGKTITKAMAKILGCDNCKRMPYCGNGVVEYPEACDDPSDSRCDRKTCTYAGCGDGKVDSSIGEECDPPGSKGCLSNCRKSKCGDGYTDTSVGEECDDGNDSNEDMCTTLCKKPYCGDGIVSLFLGEVCDDGQNTGAYGGCAMDCSFRPPYCGDGIVTTTSGETCDDGVNNGSYNGCTSDCHKAGHCGDGVRQPEREECDDGNDVAKDGCTSCVVDNGYLCEENENDLSICKNNQLN